MGWTVILLRGPKPAKTYTHTHRDRAFCRATDLADLHGVKWSEVAEKDGVFTVDAAEWYTPRKR